MPNKDFKLYLFTTPPSTLINTTGKDVRKALKYYLALRFLAGSQIVEVAKL